MRRLWAGVALVLWACPAESPPTDGRPALRVPLPEGWRATPATGGLQVGPSGRVVLQLESMSAVSPSLEQLVGALEREKVAVLEKESLDSFVGVRYRLGESGDEGFVGVRRISERRDGGVGRTVWCATTKGAKADEVEAAMKVCGGVSEPSGS